jgi:CRP-like cAMP-binding protein
MEDTLYKYLTQYISLTSEEVELFDNLSLVRKYKKGDFLLREGQYAKEYFFVLKGCLRSYYLVNGEEKTTAFFMEEESIAPESLMDQKPSEYFIVCEEDCLMLVATPEIEEKVFAEFPKFESLCRILSEKELSKKQTSISNYIKSTAEERYLDLQKNRPQLLQRVPQYQIASFIGIKPETLSRIRKKVRE